MKSRGRGGKSGFSPELGAGCCKCSVLFSFNCTDTKVRLESTPVPFSFTYNANCLKRNCSELDGRWNSIDNKTQQKHRWKQPEYWTNGQNLCGRNTQKKNDIKALWDVLTPVNGKQGYSTAAPCFWIVLKAVESMNRVWASSLSLLMLPFRLNIIPALSC